jgi:hypothetical protein
MEIRLLLRAVMLCATPVLGVSQTFTLTGYVIDGLTNRSMPGIRVHLYEWSDTDPTPLGGHGPAAVPVTSDSEGHFAFTHLSRGDYILQAELPHEIYTYGEAADFFQKNAIHVAAESEGHQIVFRVLPRANIQGFVHGEHEEDVEYAGVNLYRRGRVSGRIELIYAGSSRLDSLGRYTLADLWPGDYVVCAEPPGPLLRPFAPSGESEVEYHPGGSPRVYVETCYPDPKSPTTPFHLASAEQRNLDLKLRSAPSVTIKTNLPAVLFQSDLPRLLEMAASDELDPPEERWRIRNVPPGRFNLLGVGNEPGSLEDTPSFARIPIVVESQPLTFELHPEKTGKLKVHLHGSDGRSLSEGASVAFVRLTGRTRVDVRYGEGYYIIDPGDYWISIRPNAPFCAVFQTLTGATLRNGKITVTPGMSATLDVELGTGCGTVDVRAVSNGDAVPFASFLLLVSGTPQEPGDVLTGSVDAHGHATIPRVPPGRYWLWMWVPSGDGYLGPDLAGEMARAVEVVVGAGQHAPVSVDPIRSAGGSR